MKHLIVVLAIAMFGATLPARPSAAGPAASGPQTLYCTFAICPDIAIAGDPFAMLGGSISS